ncbi:uncharacterized protein LOC124177893 [Neodiprion fabricii]|uniref:uncharacterized protein LOC124177893 n=1 Tax=Neodiprion fabricii TaxID=2872261 RepID=UPI001ED90ADD|nr:uncharacterized protein LOC124177893 [Neodiprion fabricii]
MQEILKVLLTFSHFIIMINSEGILCYKCTPTREYKPAGPYPCSEFDWSERFQVECPKSTLCMKITSTTVLGQNEVTIVERDCAPQKLATHKYNGNKKKWYSEEKIVKSAYSEGCETQKVEIPRKYCYCGLHLCNGSESDSKIFSSDIILRIAGLMLCIWQNFHV